MDMDTYLAFYPVPANISPEGALNIAVVLLEQPSLSYSRIALAMSLMHGSWTVGRMHLAAHLRHLNTSLEAPGWVKNFVEDPSIAEAAELMDDAAPVLEALSAVSKWSALIHEDPRGTDASWDQALEGLADVLALQPDAAKSREILNRLLALPSERKTATLSPGAFRVTGVQMDPLHAPKGLLAAIEAARASTHHHQSLFLPTDAAGKMDLLQALLGTGMIGLGTTTGRLNSRAAHASNTPKPGQLGAAEENENGDAQKISHQVRVFDRQEVIQILESLPPSMTPFDDNKKQQQLMQSMANDSGLRAMAQTPDGDILESLYARFPHFTPVIDYVRNSLALAGCGTEGRPARIAPMLLRGSPGTGKTFFSQELARLLGVKFLERDLSVTSEAFVINGMDASWKNSKPGIVFDAVVNGKQANPLILLNEVDKATTTGHKNSPLAPMHALLEPTSAARFVDEFVPVPVDASNVIWVLTANDGHIPDPILSRLEVFDIPEPTIEECVRIAQSVWTSLCERTLPKGHGFPEQLSPGVLEKMSKVSPRVMRKALTHAASIAVVDGRKYLMPEDLEASGKRYAPVEKRSIGFNA